MIKSENRVKWTDEVAIQSVSFKSESTEVMHYWFKATTIGSYTVVYPNKC